MSKLTVMDLDSQRFRVEQELGEPPTIYPGGHAVGLHYSWILHL